ncbi:hypothetical protein BDW72DRAFT_179000 [Aspergillus terricola var. indicus]
MMRTLFKNRYFLGRAGRGMAGDLKIQAPAVGAYNGSTEWCFAWIALGFGLVCWVAISCLIASCPFAFLTTVLG